MDITLIQIHIWNIHLWELEVSILVLMDITLILVQSQTIAITHIQQY